MRSRKNSPKFVYFFFNAIGILLIIYGLYLFSDSLSYKLEGKAATGKIVEMIRNYKHRAKAKNVNFKARIAYTYEGKAYQFTNSTSYGNQRSYYKVGDSIDLLVLDPVTEKVRISSAMELWILPSVFVFVGGIICVIVRKQRRKVLDK